MAILYNNFFDELDTYDLRHYVEHLIDGGEGTSAHRILNRESQITEVDNGNWVKRLFKDRGVNRKNIQFRNEWFHAQEKIGEIRNFIKDVRLCWKVAETESKKSLGENQIAPAVGLEARYALISSCLNNLAGNIPPILLARLLEEKILNVEQTLTLINQIPSLPQRALTLAVAALRAESSKRGEMFELMFALLRSMRDDIALAKVLVKIAETVKGTDILLELANAAHNIGYVTSRVEALLGLAPLLPENLRAEAINAALTAARETSNETDRAINLIKVSEHFEDSEKTAVLKAALEIISSFENLSSKEYSQSEALRYFVRAAPDVLLPPALGISETFSDKQYRAKVHLALAARLFVKGETENALRIFENYDNPLFDTHIAPALLQMIPSAPAALLPELLEMTLKISSEYFVPEVLAKLAPRLLESSVKRTTKAVRAMHTADAKIRSKAALATRMLDFSNPKLFGEVVNAILRDALPTTALEDVLELLAPRMNAETLRQIFSVVQKINDHHQQILTVISLSDYLPAAERSNVLQDEISRARFVIDENQHSEALAQIVVKFAMIKEFDRAFELAFKLRPHNWRAKALAGILASSPDELKKQVYQRIIEHWKRKGEQPATGELLKNLAPHLTPAFAFEALEIVSRLDDLYRAQAYADITPFVPASSLRELVIPQLKSIGDNPNMNDFSRRFAEQRLSLAVAARLAELGAEDEAFDLANSLSDELTRGSAFEKIIPHLTRESLLRLREESAKFPYEGTREWIDGCLAARFAALGEDEAASQLLAGIKNAIQRAQAYANAAQFAGGELQVRAVNHALEIVNFMQNQAGFDSWQAEVFAKLSPHLSLDRLRSGWQLSLKIDDDDGRRKSLSALTTKLLEFDSNELYSFWSAAAHALSSRSRKSFLTDLQTLAVLINSLGGAAAINEAITAVRQTGRWW